jgi:hypothetical protein
LDRGPDGCRLEVEALVVVFRIPPDVVVVFEQQEVAREPEEVAEATNEDGCRTQREHVFAEYASQRTELLRTPERVFARLTPAADPPARRLPSGRSAVA